jgi:hypothetical protein
MAKSSVLEATAPVGLETKQEACAVAKRAVPKLEVVSNENGCRMVGLRPKRASPYAGVQCLPSWILPSVKPCLNDFAL